MTRYATYFFIATPCSSSLFFESPYESYETKNGERIFNVPMNGRRYIYISSRFFFPFRTLLSSIDKNKFRTRASIFSPIDDDSRSIIKIHLLDSRCSFLFRERERGNSVMLAFLLETISYRVSRAKLSCCSTRFLASFFCRVFLTSGSKVW